ncbi:hypothetical protein ACFVDH_13670 [Streptomyces sp. NPDC057674]|uniref:hypothetical protein n=1 Tax=Streptomyces sp. NPDC057674 TaxID=3346203 RepID=UPI00368E2D0B
MASLKDQISKATDIKEQRDVEIPEWVPGVKFLVRGVPSGAWEKYQNSLTRMTRRDEASGIEMRVDSRKAEIVAKGLYDQETATLVFPDLREGIAILSKRDAGIINGLFELIRHLSGDGRSFLQKVQDAEGDFGDGQS